MTMQRLIILLFVGLVSFGLLVACSNPSAQPMDGNGNGNGDGNGTPMEPMEPVEPPAPADLDLTLLGWTGRVVDTTTPANTDVAGSFTWGPFEIDDAGAGGIDTILYLVFTDGATDLSVNAAAVGAAAPGTACGGLENVDVDVSGLTISFSGELDAACDNLIATFDPDGAGSATTRATLSGDEVAFEITLADPPDTTPVPADDAEDQEIDVTGTVTITGGGADDEGSVSFDISGEVEYNVPTITTEKAN